ncbi:hypothetical protein [Nocardia sp. NPDC050406]|uniref:hypothetical protein n=1 Tax=Nocardia sp. NPDC050406 TaxID=3364318 RepID=UPI00378CF804
MDIKTFGLEAADHEVDVLRALIAHEQFRDGYIGGGPGAGNAEHGPYRLECVGVDSYERIDPELAVGVVEEWAGQFGTVSPDLAGELEREVLARFRNAGEVFVLRELEDDAVVEYGQVHCEFHEFVTVDRTLGEVALIVAADD